MNKSDLTSFKSTAFILAGGKSLRMGTDKGLIDFNGKKMVSHVIDCISPLFSDVRIISNNPQYNQFGFTVYEDGIINIGPIGGILTALQLSETNWNFFIACDMPFMNSSVIKLLVDEQFNGNAIVPVYKNFMEPLCAFYNVNSIPFFETQIADANFKLHDLIEKMEVKKIVVPEFHFLKENPFRNINTNNDLLQSVSK